MYNFLCSLCYVQCSYIFLSGIKLLSTSHNHPKILKKYKQAQFDYANFIIETIIIYIISGVNICFLNKYCTTIRTPNDALFLWLLTSFNHFVLKFHIWLKIKFTIGQGLTNTMGHRVRRTHFC